MPNIRQYESPVDSLRPSEIGIHALGQAASTIGAYARQTKASIDETGRDIKGAFEIVDDTVTHMEISRGVKEFSELTMAKQKEWEEAAKDPAAARDPDFGKNFLNDKIKPSADEFVGSFTSVRARKWAEERAASLTGHMFTKTTADLATIAGHAIKTDVIAALNNYTTIVRTDPTAVMPELRNYYASIDAALATSPNLSAAQRAEIAFDLKQKGGMAIVKAAAYGMAEANPEAFLRPGGGMAMLAKKFPGLVDAVEMNVIAKYAQQQQRLERGELRAVADERRRLLQEQAHININRATASLIQPNGTLAVPKGYFATLKQNMEGLEAVAPGLYWSAVEHATSVLNRKPDETIVTDIAVEADLVKRLSDETNPTTMRQLLEADTAKKLSTASYTRLHRAVTGMRDEAFANPIFREVMQNAEKILVASHPALPGKDTVGLQKHSGFVTEFMPAYAARVRSNKALPNDLDVNDPASFISQYLNKYKRDAGTMFRDTMAGWSLDGILAPDKALPAAPGPKSGLNYPETFPMSLRKPGMTYSGAHKKAFDTTTGKYYDAHGKETEAPKQ